tara:strand:+ start:4021 stop:4797 length:777 start_codon:yes stop_codon:yes gene_type:complete
MAGWLDSLIDFGIKAAPTVAKAGLSYLGQQETAQSQQQTAQAQIDQLNQNAAAAQAAATPWNVGSLGGTAGFNPDTQTSSLLLSPELSNVYSGLLSRSGMFGGQAGQYANLDPFMAGEQFYQQQQQYYEPDEQRLRTELETRLLNQGRLGATGGQNQQQMLEEAIGRNQQQRRTAGFSQAQGLIDTLLGRESGDMGQAVGLLDVPLQQGKLGLGIGGTLGNAAATGLESRAEGIKNLNDINQGNSSDNMYTALRGLFK